LLREQGSPGERLALYRTALEQATEPARRRELYHAIGAIERRDLGDAAAALATYRRALAEQPDDRRAFDALLEIYEAQGAWGELRAELGRALDRAAGEERAALLLRSAQVAAAHGALDEAALRYAEMLAGSATLSEDVLAAAEQVARAVGDNALVRAVLERRVAVAIEPQEESTWLAQLGELLRGGLSDAAGAADAFRRAASAAATAGDPGREAMLLERVLDAAPKDRAAADRLLALHTAAEAWERLPAVYIALLHAAPTAADATRTLLAFEAPAQRAG